MTDSNARGFESRDTTSESNEEIASTQAGAQHRERLLAAAAAAGATLKEVPDAELAAQQTRLLELADRDDDERWEYEPTLNLAHVRSGLLNADLDALCDHPSGTIETLPIKQNEVPLEFAVSTDDDESIETLVYLTPDQAEALAVDLLEQARAAREDNDA